MKHGDAPERRLLKCAEKYNNKRISATVKHEGRVLVCVESFQMSIDELLHWENSFNGLEYRRIMHGLLPTKCFFFFYRKRNDQMLFFQQDNGNTLF